MGQMTFKDIELQEKLKRAEAITSELDRRCKAVAYAIGRAEFANISDKSISYINEMLNTNNEEMQKPWQFALISSLLVADPDKFKAEIIDFLCELTGYQLPEKTKDLTPEEELRQIKQKIKAHGLESIFEDIGK